MAFVTAAEMLARERENTPAASNVPVLEPPPREGLQTPPKNVDEHGPARTNTDAGIGADTSPGFWGQAWNSIVGSVTNAGEAVHNQVMGMPPFNEVTGGWTGQERQEPAPTPEMRAAEPATAQQVAASQEWDKSPAGQATNDLVPDWARNQFLTEKMSDQGLFGKLQGKDQRPSRVRPEGFLESAAYGAQAATLSPEYFIAGPMLKGAAFAGAVAKNAVFGAGHSAVGSLADMYHEGKLSDPEAWYDATTDAGKQALTWSLFGAFGIGGELAAAKGLERKAVAEEARRLLASDTFKGNPELLETVAKNADLIHNLMPWMKTGAKAGEFATLAGGNAAMEGRMPTAEEVGSAAGVMGAFLPQHMAPEGGVKMPDPADYPFKVWAAHRGVDVDPANGKPTFAANETEASVNAKVERYLVARQEHAQAIAGRVLSGGSIEDAVRADYAPQTPPGAQDAQEAQTAQQAPDMTSLNVLNVPGATEGQNNADTGGLPQTADTQGVVPVKNGGRADGAIESGGTADGQPALAGVPGAVRGARQPATAGPAADGRFSGTTGPGTGGDTGTRDSLPVETGDRVTLPDGSSGTVVGKNDTTATVRGDDGKGVRVPVGDVVPETTTTADPTQVAVVELPTDSIALSKDMPQFKEGAESNTGVVDKLQGKFQRLGTAPIVVWRRLNGALEVITGRHRLDLAKRSGESTIPAQVVNEADGFTREKASIFDAESNIRDGQGSLRDYAHFFRKTGYTAEDADARGLVRGDKAKQGFALGIHASDDLYALWRNREISDAKAVAIVNAAGADHALQAVGTRFALDNPRASAEEVGATTKAFQHIQGEDGVQTDMFGNADYGETIREAQARAKIALEKQRSIAEQLRILKLGKIDPAKAREVGITIDVQDRGALEQTKARLSQELERWKDWPQHPDLVREVMGQESERGTQQETPQDSVGQQEVLQDTADNADQRELFSEEPPKKDGIWESVKQPPSPPKAERTTAENQPRVELPGLVELAKRLLDKVPHIKERLQKKRALGVFRPGEVQPDIQLRGDIFIGPMLGHAKTKDVTSMDALRTMASQKWNVPEKDIVIRREDGVFKIYQRDHDYAGRTLAHEIGHAMDWLDSKTMTRGNILGHIAQLHRFLSTTLNEGMESITAKDRKELRRQAIRRVKDMGLSWKEDKDAYNAALRDEYGTLVAESIEDRGMLVSKEVMTELKDLTQWWKPFDEEADARYTAYRHSPAELYADALSVMLNDPAALRDHAPNFSEAFDLFRKQRPEVQETLDVINEEIRSGTDLEATEQRLRAGLRRGDEREAQVAQDRADMEKKKWSPQEIMRRIAWKLWDRTTYVPGKAGRRAMQDIAYSGAQALRYGRHVWDRVIMPARQAGVTDEDLGLYMQLKRSATERMDFANPGGVRGERAKEQLAHLEQKLGPEKYKAMVDAVEEYRKVREEQIIPLLKDSGLYTPELMDKIINNPDYATFSVVDYMDGKYGTGLTGHIFQQKGTFNDIMNPLWATAHKDLAMMKAAMVNMGKNAAVKAIAELEPEAMKRVELAFSKGGMKYPEPESGQGMLVLMRDGKPDAYHVRKEVADLFQNSPSESAIIWRMAETILATPIKRVLVTNNPFFGLWNLKKDTKGNLVNLPGLDSFMVLWHNAKTAKSAALHAFAKESDPLIDEMLANGELIAGRTWDPNLMTGEGTVERSGQGQTALERMAYEFDRGEQPQWWKRTGRAVFNDWNHFTETWSKAAAHSYLKARGYSKEEIVRYVRNLAGSPDFLAHGDGYKVLNTIFMFSNAATQGIRQTVGAVKDRPAEYMIKRMAYTVLPKLIVIGLAKGAFSSILGDDKSKWFQDAYGKISDWDKTTTIPVPLAFDGKQTLRMRIPEDHAGQVISAALWLAFGSDNPGWKGESANQAISGFLPWGEGSIAPAIQVATDALAYMQGNDPIDSFTNQPVVDKTVFAAGGMPSHVEFAKQEWNKLFSSIYKFDRPFNVRQKKAVDQLFDKPGLNQLKRFVSWTDQGDRDEERFTRDKKAIDQAEIRVPAKTFITDEVATLDSREKADYGGSYDRALRAGVITAERMPLQNYKRLYNSLVVKRFGK